MHIHTGYVCDTERTTRLDALDPRCRVLCALVLAAVLASVRSLPALAFGALIPLFLLFADEIGPLAKTLLHLNTMSVFVCLLMPLTYPGERMMGFFSVEGLKLALLITVKLNLISIVLIRMVVSLGMGKIDNVLGDFRLPEKLRVLLLMSMRCVFLLTERVTAMIRAIRLRAPELKGLLLCRTFACMLGTTLIHSSDRAERSMMAIRCRGGLGGFSQCCPLQWRKTDTLFCLFWGLNIGAIIALSLVWRP